MTDRPNSFPGVLSDREADSGLLGPRGAVRSTVSETPGKPKRRAVPPHMLVSVAILQAVNGGLRCPLCTKVLTTNHKRILEHLTPVAFGGQNSIDNLRWVHAECAARKTNGNAATSASGDLHKIAKAKRLAKAQEVHEAVLAGTHKREPSRLKSRGFDRTFRKRMNGRVERV